LAKFDCDVLPPRLSQRFISGFSAFYFSGCPDGHNSSLLTPISPQLCARTFPFPPLHNVTRPSPSFLSMEPHVFGLVRHPNSPGQSPPQMNGVFSADLACNLHSFTLLPCDGGSHPFFDFTFWALLLPPPLRWPPAKSHQSFSGRRASLATDPTTPALVPASSDPFFSYLDNLITFIRFPPPLTTLNPLPFASEPFFLRYSSPPPPLPFPCVSLSQIFKVSLFWMDRLPCFWLRDSGTSDPSSEAKFGSCGVPFCANSLLAWLVEFFTGSFPTILFEALSSHPSPPSLHDYSRLK